MAVILPKSLVSIGAEAFSGCALAGDLVAPKSLTDIGPGAFAGCWGLDKARYEEYPEETPPEEQGGGS